jgi:antitoxin component YwqK of YwqJK toxin-antitoxin module
MRTIGMIYLMLFLVACGNSGKAPKLKPYFFDRDALDKMVENKPEMHILRKRGNGTLEKEFYYLGDTVKYELLYNKNSQLQTVYKRNEHGMQVWQENYYPSGQRMGHYSLAESDSVKNGIAVYYGKFEEYHEDGALKSKGMFKNGQLQWQITFDKEGNAGDTLVYDYK